MTKCKKCKHGIMKNNKIWLHFRWIDQGTIGTFPVQNIVCLITNCSCDRPEPVEKILIEKHEK